MKGILFVNLGSPDSPSVKDVRKYLDEFLMDKRVIDIPYLMRCFLVKCIILNTRPKRSAEAYRKIWTPEGSPLITISKKFTEKIRKKIKEPIALAMRYGSLSIKEGIFSLASQKVDHILLFPLYPQFAMASTETIIALSQKIINKYFPHIKLDIFPPFYEKESYIDVLSKSIEETLSKHDYDHLLFSYHGIPARHIKKSDIMQNHCQLDKICCDTASQAHRFCYRHQCYATTQSIVDKLNLKPGFYTTCFQSRLGKDPWLEPYTDFTIVNKAENGIKKLAIVMPAFVTDCLETLEEIKMEGKNEFKKNMGEKFTAIPCLNDRDDWVDTVSFWINDWLENGMNFNV